RSRNRLRVRRPSIRELTIIERGLDLFLAVAGPEKRRDRHATSAVCVQGGAAGESAVAWIHGHEDLVKAAALFHDRVEIAVQEEASANAEHPFARESPPYAVEEFD